ncbi:MAG: DUF6151 family protein [Pseudomonadota bacterium]
MTHAIWKCDCGSVEATLPTDGMRLVCYCESCRGFVERLGSGDRLNAAGGNDLLQVAPDQVEIRGAEHLRWMKMTEKGPTRWYTACCSTPMANTLGTRKVPFASFQVHDIRPAEAVPAIDAHVNLKGALARVEEPLGSMRAVIFSFISRVLSAWVTGRWRRNPFFTQDGKPIAERQDP